MGCTFSSFFSLAHSSLACTKLRCLLFSVLLRSVGRKRENRSGKRGKRGVRGEKGDKKSEED